MENAYVYIVFSATPYRMGKFIRRITKEPYNHVSVSLEEGLTRMYGFARRYYRTPFYGGFVAESLSRYCPGGSASQIRLCRLPVTGEQYRLLSQALSDLEQRREHYLYNHLSALFSIFRRRAPVKDAYTCAEFAVRVLHGLGLPLKPEKYYSVGDLERLLEPYAVYTGPIPHPGDFDEAYYARHPLPHPVLATLRDIFALFPRLGK